jgi:hypothetical protein
MVMADRLVNRKLRLTGRQQRPPSSPDSDCCGKIIMPHLTRNRLLGIFFLLTFPLFLISARSTYQDDRPNDTTSAYYACYGRNLIRYPVSATRLLNIDLVSPEMKTIFPDKPVSYYLDHPPLLTWSVALAMKIKGLLAPSGSDLLAARLVNILASLGSMLILLSVCQRAFGSTSALFAGAALLSCPIFLAHGIVVNFEPLCTFLILLGFLGQHPLLFVPALLADWPAYFALPAYAFFKQAAGNRSQAILALAVGFVLGAGILLAYGYAIGSLKYPLTFIKGTAAFEADRYLNHYSQLLKEARAIIRIMVIANFGPLNCLVVFIGCIHWLKNLPRLNNAQIIGISSVFVTVTNIVLFHSWAAGHTFWSYYLLPAIVIAYADLARRQASRRVLGLCLCASILYSAFLYIRQLPINSPRSSVEEKNPLLLTGASSPLFTDNRHAYFGHGYVARWYFDRPLTFAPTPLASVVTDSCAEQPCIWLKENQEVDLPKEQFTIIERGSIGNLYLTSFQLKSRR